MSRDTITRAWTAAEEADATLIVDYVAAYGGDLIGAWYLAQMLGYSNPRTSGRKRVYDIMPLAVMLAPQRFPGHSLVVVNDPGGALYKVTQSSDLVKRSAMPRVRQVNTKILRLQGEIEALRADVGDLGSVYLVSVIDQMASLCKAIAPTLDAISAMEKAQADSE